MPPNFNDISGPSPVNFVDGPKEQPSQVGSSSNGPSLKATRSLTTLVAHMLIGIITGAGILFAFNGGSLPLSSFSTHVLLCILGFQFLMAEAILSLAPDSWLSTLNLKHKRWIHSALQVIGSALALAGCFVMIPTKTNHWNTLHGRFALVAMVFTSVSLVNGLASLYAYQLRRVVPGILSRLTHICFGIVAMGAASISLCYGFDKNSFRNWATPQLANMLIVMTSIMTVIVIINPFIVFYQKLTGVFRN